MSPKKSLVVAVNVAKDVIDEEVKRLIVNQGFVWATLITVRDGSDTSAFHELNKVDFSTSRLVVARSISALKGNDLACFIESIDMSDPCCSHDLSDIFFYASETPIVPVDVKSELAPIDGADTWHGMLSLIEKSYNA